MALDKNVSLMHVQSKSQETIKLEITTLQKVIFLIRILILFLYKIKLLSCFIVLIIIDKNYSQYNKTANNTLDYMCKFQVKRRKSYFLNCTLIISFIYNLKHIFTMYTYLNIQDAFT